MLFTSNMIPANINTMEKLHAWSSTVLHFHAFSLQYNERPPNANFGDSGIQDVMEKNGPRKSFQGDSRVIYRAALPLEPDYDGAAYNFIWEAVQEITTAVPNVDFLDSGYTP